MNAYVTGFGASKRVVVWDTSLTKATPDEILFIFGHESGHYVLNHIPIGVFFTELTLLHRSSISATGSSSGPSRRFGARWRIPSQDDWGALAVLLLAFAIFSAVLEPDRKAPSAAARSTPQTSTARKPSTASSPIRSKLAKGAFDVLGANSLDEPNTPLFIEFWTDGHPATGRRAAFAAHYDPWASDAAPKYFPKQ